ncbi:hypothetical protein DQP58_00080 [Mycobacterium colombiense]|uniref:Uncharacterized protein n=1 Tax=Mycobacterium colombiense TaxID=339268 RepID=A0A329L307_9MYCO|nr:hypothetical protein DQP58_00080 [Mycobacterium colombiense]
MVRMIEQLSQPDCGSNNPRHLLRSWRRLALRADSRLNRTHRDPADLRCGIGLLGGSFPHMERHYIVSSAFGLR